MQLTTYYFKIIYCIDTDVPGDTGMRSRVIKCRAEDKEAAEEAVIESYWDDETISIESFTH